MNKTKIKLDDQEYTLLNTECMAQLEDTRKGLRITTIYNEILFVLVLILALFLFFTLNDREQSKEDLLECQVELAKYNTVDMSKLGNHPKTSHQLTHHKGK